MANRMRINGGPWINLPRYPLGRPLKSRCPYNCNRLIESKIYFKFHDAEWQLTLCSHCKPSLESILPQWREHRKRIASLGAA